MNVLIKWHSCGSRSGREEHGHDLSGSKHTVNVFLPSYQECSAYAYFGY
jgi:hypothetical protein